MCTAGGPSPHVHPRPHHACMHVPAPSLPDAWPCTVVVTTVPTHCARLSSYVGDISLWCVRYDTIDWLGSSTSDERPMKPSLPSSRMLEAHIMRPHASDRAGPAVHPPQHSTAIPCAPHHCKVSEVFVSVLTVYHVPGDSVIFVTLLGRGCAMALTISAHKKRTVHAARGTN